MAAALALGLAGRAGADQIRVDYTATVASVGVELAGGPIALGDTVSATLVYDLSVADGIPDPSYGVYPNAAVAYSISVGSYSAMSVAPAAVQVHDDLGGTVDDIAVNMITNSSTTQLSGPDINGIPLYRIQFYLFSDVLSTLASDALPTDTQLLAFSPSDGTSTFNFMIFGESNPANVRFNLTSLSATRVPEPSLALLLAASGLAALACRRRLR